MRQVSGPGRLVCLSPTSANFDGPSVIQVEKIPARMEVYVATSERILLCFPGLSVSYINS